MDLVLKKLEHWAYRLYPKFKFEDCLKKIETLGKKRPVMVGNLYYSVKSLQLHKMIEDQSCKILLFGRLEEMFYCLVDWKRRFIIPAAVANK